MFKQEIQTRIRHQQYELNQNGQKHIIHIGRYDINDYQDNMNQHLHMEQNNERQIEEAIQNHINPNRQHKQSEDVNVYDDEFYGEIEGERVEKSGNTYNEYMDQEDIFDDDQVNYDRMPQLGVRSNYSSNNTNTNNNLNSQNQQLNNIQMNYQSSQKNYQNYDKHLIDYSGGSGDGQQNIDSCQNNNNNKDKNNVKRLRNNNNDQAQQYLMKQFFQGNGSNCQICLTKISLATIVQEQLHDKYFELFNFYFAKGINEILANLNISHVILFKDYLFYDDDSEYLKRYYQDHEIFPRFNLLADFYAHQYKETRPNLCIISQSKIINKRNYKQAKLFIYNQERAYRVNDQQNNQQSNQMMNLDHPPQEGQQVLSPSLATQDKEDQIPITNFLNELDTNYDNTSAQNNPNNQSGFLKQGNGHLRRHQNTLQLEQQQYKDGSFMDEFNRFDKENSFESKSHDIYYPSYTSENESRSSINKDPLNQLKSLTNRDGSNNNSQMQANYILELKLNWNDDIFIKNPNIRLRGNFVSIQSRSISNIHMNQRNNNNNNNNHANPNNTNTVPIQDRTNLGQISTSGQLTPKYGNYQYNELQDIESEMPSYLKMYVEEAQNISFSQQQQSGNVSSQLSPINHQQAQQFKYIQTFQLQQQISQLQQLHAVQLSDDKKKQQQQLHLPENKHFAIQGGQMPTPYNSQIVSNYSSQTPQTGLQKDNKFKIPISKLSDNINNNNDQWKQPPLSARNHVEANEDLRKKKNQNQKLMAMRNESDNFLNKGVIVTPIPTGQQINDLTSNSSQNQHEKLILQQLPQSQNPSSNALNQNSFNVISTDQNLPDQLQNEFTSVITTPRDQQQKAFLQQQQLSKTASKNSQLRVNKMPLQVDTKPENNYDYLLKENPLSGGLSGPSLKIHAQQIQQQQNMAQQQLLQQQQQYATQCGLQQQGKSNSLLNRLPQSVKQQLALNLQDNEQLQKNLKLNQNQQSPDRIWTDRDVNPRLAANPQKERPHQQNTVVIGKGEVKHLKGGKVLNRPLSNNNELIGSLSDRMFLNKIEEEGRNHHHGYDYNKFLSEQHKDLSQKIIQNALNNQINKTNSHSNIQDIYLKYQQAKEETNSNEQSIKGSGEHLSFIRSIQQKHDENINEAHQKIGGLQNSANTHSDHKEDNNNPNSTNHIKQQLNKQKQQQITDDMISKIHKSKVNQLIQKAVPNSSSQSSSRKGVTANSSNIHGNVAKQSINNSSSQNSNYATTSQYQQHPQQLQNQNQNQQLQRSQNKKSPPHSNNYNNIINFQSQSSNNNINQQTSSGSSNTNQTNFHNSQLHQHLYQHNVDLYNNSISTISNTVMSKLQQELKPSISSSSKRTQHKDQHNNGLNKQARTSSLIKNLSGCDEIFNESNYKVQKQQKPNQVSTAIIVPSPQHLLQQYQAEQLSHQNYMGGSSTQNNCHNKSPISSTVSTSKAVNQKQQSYSSMHNHLSQQNNNNNKPHAGKNTPNSTAGNSNQNGKAFFKSINASGNTSGQALKQGSQSNNVNNNTNNHIININTILTNNYVSPSNHVQQSTTPLGVINNFKSTNNTSVKSYQESHQNSMDKNGSASRQLQYQQQQLLLQNQKNNSTNQSTFNNINLNHVHNLNVNNSTFNQNNIINFDVNSQLSRTIMSTNNRGGGFIEVNSFNNNNNETTLNQKSLIQPGSSHSTTGITHNAILLPNTPVLSSHTGGNLPSSQKISSPNHKKKQKSESLSKSSQKINNNQNMNNNANHLNSQFNASQNIQFISNELSGGILNNQQSPSVNGTINIAGVDISQQNLQSHSKQGIPSPSSQSQNTFVPLKKQEFKLNISKIINQQHEFNQNSKNLHSNSTTHMNSHNINNLMMHNQNEENQENSYGFWTSRSNKQTYQHSSQLQQYGQHGSASSSKYSSTNSKQTNLTDRKMLKTSNVSKQRKEVPAANLTDRNQYHRSQQYQPIQQKSENQKPSPSMRKSNIQKVQNTGQQYLSGNMNSKSIENHQVNYNSLNIKEKTNGLSGSGSITGFVQKK